MPLAFQPPLPPADGWAAHRKEVRQCRGAACYAALSHHFGTFSGRLLEQRVGRRPPSMTQWGDPTQNNTYRRWMTRGHRPDDKTLEEIYLRTGGSLLLKKWRDLALWELLDPDPIPMQRLHALLEAMPLRIRKILFIEGKPNFSGRFEHTTHDREMTYGIRNLFSLEAFMTLLCLARKGELLEEDPLHFLPMYGAYDIFPRVLYRHPPLEYQWESLYRCIERVYWLRTYGNGGFYPLGIETIAANLKSLKDNPNRPLRMQSGPRKFSVETNDADGGA